MRSVGIDLTGSKKRRTGVALLCNTHVAKSARLSTNQDIIEFIKNAKPDIVSIDSPLSLPENPDKIYRTCELSLRRRGIYVFWCLLPSMKALTLRGIWLANYLRTKGQKVIESYPGATQDILGIPRKSKGATCLADGLRKYGISGSLDVSHDELDAVTAAIVGQLYLHGKYERLGSLILPRKGNRTRS